MSVLVMFILSELHHMLISLSKSFSLRSVDPWRSEDTALA